MQAGYTAVDSWGMLPAELALAVVVQFSCKPWTKPSACGLRKSTGNNFNN